MARPRSTDPQVPLPVRLPTSLLEHLRRQATEAGVSLTGLVRSRLDDRSGLDPRQQVYIVPPPMTVVDPILVGVDLPLADKTEHVDLRPGAPTCDCETPRISKYVPVCLTCSRKARP